MKKYVSGIAIGILLLGQQVLADSFIKIESRYNESLYISTVSDENIASTPVWPEEQPNPPLAPRKAISLARDFFTKGMTNYKEWKLDSIALKNFRDDKWYYVVTFTLDMDGFTTLPSPTVQIVVLMDSRIVTLKGKFTESKQKNSYRASDPHR